MIRDVIHPRSQIPNPDPDFFIPDPSSQSRIQTAALWTQLEHTMQ